MPENWNYFPIFKSTERLMAELSDEDFGKIIRAAIVAKKDGRRPEGLSDTLYILYKVIVEEANRVYERREEKELARERRRSSRKGAKAIQIDHYGSDDISPEEALRLALERSFGNEDEDL